MASHKESLSAQYTSGRQQQTLSMFQKSW